jgi:hypothetical protein
VDITFLRRPFVNVDPTTRLRSIKIFDQATHDVLKLAFSQGGWVAGGFARIITKHHLMNGDSMFDALDGDDVADDVTRHLQCDIPCDTKDAMVKYRKGDIDLFFDHQRQLDNFWRALQATGLRSSCKLEGSVTGAATEVSVNNRTRLQVIERYRGPIEDQLRSFDIFNAMCAFNDKVLLYPDGWSALEAERMLHVVNWTSPWVINRVAKWCNRHGYDRLSPKTASEIGDVAIDLIERFKEKPYQPEWGGMPLTHDKIIARMKRFLPQLTNDQLLLMTSVYPIDAYQGPLYVLRKRAGI